MVTTDWREWAVEAWKTDQKTDVKTKSVIHKSTGWWLYNKAKQTVDPVGNVCREGCYVVVSYSMGL